MTPPVYGQWIYEVRRICPECNLHLQKNDIPEHRKGPCGYRSIIMFRPIIYMVCPVCRAEHVSGDPGTDDDRCTSCGCIMEGE